MDFQTTAIPPWGMKRSMRLPSRARDRAKVAVQPVKDFADDIETRRHVTGVVDDSKSLVLWRCAKQVDNPLLREIGPSLKIVLSSDEQHRHLYAREEIDRFSFRL